MTDRAPPPDPDDTAVCHACGKRRRGVSARRFFAAHVDCAASTPPGRVGGELRYGEFVRLIGPP